MGDKKNTSDINTITTMTRLFRVLSFKNDTFFRWFNFNMTNTMLEIVFLEERYSVKVALFTVFFAKEVEIVH
jgi:hypothetical protein